MPLSKLLLQDDTELLLQETGYLLLQDSTVSAQTILGAYMGRNRDITAGATDQSIEIRILDAATSLPLESLVYDSAGIAFWYRRQHAAKTAIALATLADLETAHADGGFLHIDDGVYRLDLPDAAVAGGSADVVIGGTATGAFVIESVHQLVGAILGSGGSRRVDHDTGGTDNLRAMSSGNPVDNVDVWAYLTSDYDAGNLAYGYVKDISRTNVLGRWERPMMLDPGDYTMLFHRQGGFYAATQEVTVA